MVVLAFAGSPAVVGCGGAVGGPVGGPADTHCDGTAPVVVDPATCDDAPTATAEDGGDDYGDTLYGREGDDDDCKYHVSFSNTAIEQNKDVTFTLTATYLADGTAVTGADPRAEVFLDLTHPAPNSGSSADEQGDGTYDVGPIQFDESGRWTVRFHLFESCVDGETSPHGHVAFYVDVP